jgi:hypothetical protein
MLSLNRVSLPRGFVFVSLSFGGCRYRWCYCLCLFCIVVLPLASLLMSQPWSCLLQVPICGSPLHLESSIRCCWGLGSSSVAAFAFMLTLACRTVLCSRSFHIPNVSHSFCISRLTRRQIMALGVFDGCCRRLSWILVGVCGFYRLRVGQVVLAFCTQPDVFVFRFHASPSSDVITSLLR